MSESIRYRIYPLWMWIVVGVFVVTSCSLANWANYARLDLLTVNDLLIGIAPLLAIVFFILRMARTKNSRSCVEMIVFLCFGIILSAILLPNIEMATCYSRWHSCAYDLKGIGAALHTYHEKNGHLPPAITTASEDKAPRSWRTVLVEGGFMEEETDYPPTVPTEDHRYVAVIGEGTAWAPDGKTRTFDDIVEPSNTAVLLEMDQSKPDAQPGKDESISLDDLISGKISWEEEIALHPYQKDRFSRSQPGTNILMANGAVRHYIGTPTPEEIRWLFDIREKTPIAAATTDPTANRAHFQNASPKSARIPLRTTAYYVLLLCLLLMFVAIFLPRSLPRRMDFKGCAGEEKSIPGE